jgi:arylsulfatase
MNETRPKNFLILTTDQHPWDHLGCAGHPTLQTPNLDRLAAGSTRLNRCYTVHPLCMPTRATWMTGQSPRGHHTRCNGIPLDRSVPTLPQALREAGYATASIGKLHLRPFFPRRGSDPASLDPSEWPECAAIWNDGRLNAVPTPYYGFEEVKFLGAGGLAGHSEYTDWLLKQDPESQRLLQQEVSGWVDAPESPFELELPEELHFLSWMRECAGAYLRRRQQDGQPFFLMVSSPDPHPPYAAPPPYSRMYDPADMPPPRRREGELDDLPPHYREFFEQGGMSSGRTARTRVDEAATAATRAMVCGMISQVDAAFGRILDDLEALGLAEDTVVVFMADHGQMLGDHWMFSMPFTAMDGITRVPSIWRVPGQRGGRVCEGLASHLDFAPTVLELAGATVREPDAPPEIEAERQPPLLPGRSLVPLLSGEAASVQDAVHVEFDEDYLGLRLRALVTDDWQITTYAGQDYGELYDLRNDPDQLVNRWDDPALRPMRLELQSRLLDRLTLTEPVRPRRQCHA